MSWVCRCRSTGESTSRRESWPHSATPIIRFYARQRDSLGNYFLDGLFSDIDSLEIYAGVHMKVFDYHRLLGKRFPYAVYYKVDGET